MPRGEPTREPMTPLDKRCILALLPVRGMSTNAQRIAGALEHQLKHGHEITLRMRHALYAICWRFRVQLPIPLQVKVALAQSDAAMAAAMLAIEAPPRIRAYRAGEEAPSTALRNPLDDLFSTRGVAS